MKIQEALELYNKTRHPSVRKTPCHAPVTSMNFDQSGNVNVCCYNRKKIIGNVQQKSIQDIWNSPERYELIEALAKEDFSMGCQGCEEQILAGNYFGTLARNFDIHYSDGLNQNSAPEVLEFEISNICNLECIMCNGHFSSLIRRNREKLPPLPNTYDQSFVDGLKDFWGNVKIARFLGGEPFLNPLYFKIWQQMADQNFTGTTVVTTNCTIYNEKVEMVLNSLEPLLVLSIDSIQKQTYEKIRLNANFENTMANFQKFFDYSAKHRRILEIATCPMTVNWQEIPEILEWCNANDSGFGFNTVTSPSALSIRDMPLQDLKQVVNFYSEYLANAKMQLPTDSSSLRLQNFSKFQSLQQQVQHWYEVAAAL